MFQEPHPPDNEVQKNAIFFKKQHKKQDNPHFAISTLHSCLFNEFYSKLAKRLFCYLLFCYFLFSRVELSGLIEKNGEKFGGLTFIHLLCDRKGV